MVLFNPQDELEETKLMMTNCTWFATLHQLYTNKNFPQVRQIAYNDGRNHFLGKET